MSTDDALAAALQQVTELLNQAFHILHGVSDGTLRGFATSDRPAAPHGLASIDPASQRVSAPVTAERIEKWLDQLNGLYADMNAVQQQHLGRKRGESP